MNVSNWQYHGHQHQPTLPEVDRLLRAGTTGHIDREQGIDMCTVCVLHFTCAILHWLLQYWQ